MDEPAVRVSFRSENSPQSTTLQAGRAHVTPTLDPASSASPLKLHPDPHIHDGSVRVLKIHADIDTNITSSAKREPDKPNSEPRNTSLSRNEQLSKTYPDIRGTAKGTQSAEGFIIATTPSVRVQTANIQPEDPTAPVVSSGTSSVYPLSETRELRQEASSSVVTTPVSMVSRPSFKVFRATEEDASLERSTKAIFAPPQLDPTPNPTTLTPTLQSGEALGPGDTETAMSNVSGGEKIEKEEMEDKFDTVSPTGKTIPFQGAERVNGTETDGNETESEVEEGRIRADGGRFHSQSSADMISQFSSAGFSIQSETEPPQQTVKAANQPPTSTVIHHEADKPPAIRGQRVGLCYCFEVTKTGFHC